MSEKEIEDKRKTELREHLKNFTREDMINYIVNLDKYTMGEPEYWIKHIALGRLYNVENKLYLKVMNMYRCRELEENLMEKQKIHGKIRRLEIKLREVRKDIRRMTTLKEVI